MSEGIEVAEQAIKTAARDLDTVSDTLARANQFVTDRVGSEGGEFTSRSGQQYDSIAEMLSTQYDGLSRTLDDAGAAVLSIWRNFEREDEAAWDRFNKSQEKVDDTQFFPDPLGPRKPPPVTTVPHPSPASSSVDAGALNAPLVNPSINTSWIDTLNTWRDIKDKVDEIAGFEWLVSPLQNVGIHVPLDRFKAYMEGEYVQMAEQMAVYFNLADVFEAIDTDMDQVKAQLETRWLGLASTAVQDWVADFGGACSLHRGQLNSTGNSMLTQAMTLKLLLDQLIDLLGDLADLVPIIQLNGDGLINKGLSLLKGAAHSLLNAIRVAFRFATKFVLRVELLYDAVMIFLTILSSAPANLEFGEVQRPAVAR